MKPYQGLGGVLIGAASIVIAQPVWAAPTQVTGVRVTPTATGVEVVLQTQAGDRPQVFAVQRGRSWTADVINTQLRLPQGGTFQQNSPAPGITAVTVTPLDANSIRVTVTGETGTPTGQVSSRSATGLVMSVNRPGGSTAVTPPPASAPPAPVAQTPPAQAPRPTAPPPTQGPPPLVPNPEIRIDGQPVTPGSPAPPLLPRAVPPPVGDIAVGQVDSGATTIDLGTAERVPRLVLRDAPARDVLSVLARAANLNLAYVGASAEEGTITGGAVTPNQPDGQAADTSPRVSLDIENESVQDVFNYVLRIARLEANRVGRTIFVGPRLPDEARNIVTRTLRLNQVPVVSAANFLTAQGAATRVPGERVRVETIGQPPNQRFIEVREPAILPIEAPAIGTSPLILRGLSISTDARLNTITLVGQPRKVEIATSLLTQLDARRRQVAINVRVIDINLTSAQRFGASFSFGLGNTRFINTGGIGVINFGSSGPASTNLAEPQIGLSPTGGSSPFDFEFSRNFFLQLQSLVTSGDAKILTDPTLVIQEGQQAEVNLTQEVISNFEVETQPGDPPTTTVTIEKDQAGLQLQIAVDRIDDNGFITFTVNPIVRSVADTETVDIGGVSNVVALLQERSVTSGQIRVRDSQSLVLAGIIQDSERSSVRKVPILGDIPLLGALFRRTENLNQRQEVIVVLTPQIIDDSDRSSFGYTYTPTPEAQRMIDQNNRNPR